MRDALELHLRASSLKAMWCSQVNLEALLQCAQEACKNPSISMLIGLMYKPYGELHSVADAESLEFPDVPHDGRLPMLYTKLSMPCMDHHSVCDADSQEFPMFHTTDGQAPGPAPLSK